jgi:hypothetical protein
VPVTRPRNARLGLERLEDRLAPANAAFNAPLAATPGGPVQVRFDLGPSAPSRHHSYLDEVGIFAIDDGAGHVNGLLPSDPGYYNAALARAQVVFARGARTGASATISVPGGQLFGVYVVSNNTTAAAQAGKALAYFSFDAPNPDHLAHDTALFTANGSTVFHFADSYGNWDRNLNSLVLTVSPFGGGLLTPGQAGQTYQARFDRLSHKGALKHEVGIFQTDSPDGKIGNLKPGDAGYVAAALGSARQVLFSDFNPGPSSRILTLLSGKSYGFYLTTQGTADQVLASNPNDTPGSGPLAYFSFPQSNPDGKNHLAWLGQAKFGLEDGLNLGNADFRDEVIAFGFSSLTGTPTTPPPPTPPPPTPAPTPPTISAVADQTINENTATSALAFTVGSASAAANLTVTASSSNQTLIPTPNVVLGGSGASRTVMVTPASAQTGSSTITLTVSDGTLTSATSFVVTVRPVTPPSFTASATNPGLTVAFNAGAKTVAGFATFVPGQNGGQTATKYTVGDVSNPGLFLVQPTVSTNGTLTYTPVTGGFGSSTFSLSVSDGVNSSSAQTFTINVDPVQGVSPTTIPGSSPAIALNDPNWTTVPTTVNGLPAEVPNGTYPNSTRVRDVTVGAGATVTAGSMVTATIKGYQLDGTVFQPQTSFPFTATASPSIIPGFVAGFIGMKVGGERFIDIPSYLAYGQQGNGGALMNTRLVFDVTVTAVS